MEQVGPGPAASGPAVRNVQVDETYIGGDEPGPARRPGPGKKVLTGIAVEVSEPKGIGRCRMGVLADGSAESLHRS
jgi:hypothetical protein